MASPGATRRRHRSHRSKPNHRCTGPTSHAHGTHTSAEKPWPRPTLPTAPDGNKESLVQGWLDDIEARRPLPPADAGNPGLASRLSPSGRGYKRGRLVLEDSSIIAPDDERDEPAAAWVDLSQARPGRRGRRPTSHADESYYERGKKRQNPGLDSDDDLASHASSPAGHSFEKRPRRKTRGDRYDFVDHDRDNRGRKKRDKEANGTGSKRDEKKTKHDKMTSAREVMGKFVSNSILNDRITIQPSLRPGLFENGRASKKQLTDLTFHEMSFLKQPRREPQKPLSRRRESDKRRDEREREEISAFFQQKKVSEKDDVRGRKKRDSVTGLCSLGEGTGDVSTYHRSERHDRRIEQKFDSARDDRPANFHDQTEGQDREGSRASTTTCITWSTSHRSPGLRHHPTTASTARRDDEDERSPTPPRFREALAQSGIFNNTGISYSKASGFESERHGSNPGGDFVDAESQVTHHLTALTEQAAPTQPVRIVRYRDRGTMAEQDAPCADGRASQTRSTSTRARSTDSEYEKRVVAQDTTEVAAVVRNPMSPAPVCPFRQPQNTDTIKSGPTNTTDQGTTSSEGGDGLGTRPERPRSPKWAVIERLEAAAEDLKSRELLPGATNVSQVVQEHTQPVGKHDAELITQPVPVQMPCSYAPDHTHKSDWLVCGVAPAPGQNHDALSALSARLPPSLNPGDSFVRVSPPHGTSSRSVVPNHGPECTEDSFTDYHTPSMNADIATANDFPGQQHMQQSIQDYISRIEEEVLGRAQDDSGGRASPSLWMNHMHEPDLPDLGGDKEPNGIYREPYADKSGLLRDGALMSTSHQSWMHAQALEEDEEQRFLSSFWRPNRYPV